ncbi:MAG: helix-turn-helix transcriptional regulator [Thiolinea sp.]
MDRILRIWQFEAQESGSAPVIPDGCRDLIIHYRPGHKPLCFVSSLADRTFLVTMQKGDSFTGYRLKPGTGIAEDRLLAVIRGRGAVQDEQGFLHATIDDFTGLSASVAEALDCLASGVCSIAAAAKQLGVSQRTLQRKIMQQTGHSPLYWLRLARVRQAGRSVVTNTDSLTGIALHHGYADQAHMSRELKRWLGVTAGALRQGADEGRQLLESGYG